MLSLSKTIRIFLCVTAVDMRKQMNGLAITVREGLGRDPQSGEMFVFRNRRGDMVRVLFYDQQGYCLLSKRLDDGVFALARADSGDTSVELTPDQLARFLTALDWDRK